MFLSAFAAQNDHWNYSDTKWGSKLWLLLIFPVPWILNKTFQTATNPQPVTSWQEKKKSCSVLAARHKSQGESKEENKGKEKDWL